MKTYGVWLEIDPFRIPLGTRNESVAINRKLDYSIGHSPRSMCVINESVIWAKRILDEIDRLFPTKA